MTLPSGPLVSVIVPCFDYGHFVGETLQSVLAQTLTDWECLVVDDGSTDATHAVVGQYVACDTRIHYYHQPNAGHAAARNTGLSLARGRYIQFLDADDLLQSRKLEQQVGYLEAHPEIDLVYGSHDYFSAETADAALTALLDPGEAQTDFDKDRSIVRRLMERNILVTHAALFRRTLAERVGPLDTALIAAEDWDFWLRCALAGAKFHFHNWEASRALVRHHAGSYSRDRRRMLTAVLALRAKAESLTDDPVLLEVCRRKRWEETAALGKYEGIYGNAWRGADLLWKSGLSACSPQWLLYALLLPLLRLPRVRAFPRIRQALRSFE